MLKAALCDVDVSPGPSRTLHLSPLAGAGLLLAFGTALRQPARA